MTSPWHYTVNEKKQPDKFLPRDAMHSADNAVARCPSVRLSVTRRYSVETAKEIRRNFAKVSDIRKTGMTGLPCGQELMTVR